MSFLLYTMLVFSPGLEACAEITHTACYVPSTDTIHMRGEASSRWVHIPANTRFPHWKSPRAKWVAVGRDLAELNNLELDTNQLRRFGHEAAHAAGVDMRGH